MAVAFHHDFSFSSDDFPTVIDNLWGFEKLIQRERDAESLSAIHMAVGVESIKLIHHLFTVSHVYHSRHLNTLKTSFVA